MKVLAKIVVGILMFATFASAVAYTNATVKGNYSILLTSSATPTALLGLLKFDGAGNVSMIYAQPGGFTGTFSGTYAVDSNGTGMITFSSQSPAVTMDFVLSSVVNGNAKKLQLAVSSGGDGVGTATHQ
jgi:hypothetical protein